MPTTLTIGSSSAKASGEYKLLHIAIGLALLFGGYEIATRYDLVQKAEAVIYGFPANRVQAVQDAKVLNGLMTYATNVGDAALQSQVQARLNAIAVNYPGTTGTTAPSSSSAFTQSSGVTSVSTKLRSVPTSSKSSTSSTSSKSSTSYTTGGSVFAASSANVPSSVANAASALNVPIPTSMQAAHNVLISLDTAYWLNPGTNIQNLAHIEAQYIRSRFPQASPAGGYTWSQLTSLVPTLAQAFPSGPPSSPQSILTS